jgi:hypothetical protein
VRPRQLTLSVDGHFTSVRDTTCFVALTEKQLELTTARALLRDSQGALARSRRTCGDRASGCADRVDEPAG